MAVTKESRTLKAIVNQAMRELIMDRENVAYNKFESYGRVFTDPAQTQDKVNEILKETRIDIAILQDGKRIKVGSTEKANRFFTE